MIALWFFGVKSGVMVRGNFSPGRSRFLNRSVSPVRFWLTTVAWGSLALALLILPVLSWLGIRR